MIEIKEELHILFKNGDERVFDSITAIDEAEEMFGLWKDYVDQYFYKSWSSEDGVRWEEREIEILYEAE